MSPRNVRMYTGLPQPRRTDMVNKNFFFDGDKELPSGEWRVRRILDDTNQFVCTKIRGEGPVNIDNFDIGYVMMAVRHEEEHARQFGR